MTILRRAVVAVAACLLAGCGGTTAPAPSPTPSVAATAAASPGGAAKAPFERSPIVFTAPQQGDKHLYITEKQRNRKVYLLRADSERGEYSGNNTGYSTFVNPHVTFYGRDGKQLVADAPTGLVVEGSKTVRMSGGVRAHANDGTHLTSDQMLYDGGTEIIHAVGNVVMDSPQGTELRGQYLDWNLRTGELNVTGAR